MPRTGASRTAAVLLLASRQRELGAPVDLRGLLETEPDRRGDVLIYAPAGERWVAAAYRAPEPSSEVS